MFGGEARERSPGAGLLNQLSIRTLGARPDPTAPPCPHCPSGNEEWRPVPPADRFTQISAWLPYEHRLVWFYQRCHAEHQ